MLTIWGRRSSSNVQAVMWCIKELGLDYERIDAGFTYGVVNTPEYRAMNPSGTVPTLADGDNPPLWESGAIIRYLANTYAATSKAGPDFWPSESFARANVDRWAEWSKINIASNFTSPVFWQVVRTPVERQDPTSIALALEKLERYLAIAESQLKTSRYIAGENLSVADIQFGHSLFRYFDIDISRPKWPEIERYYQQLVSRSAFKDHVMVDYSELENSL